ncbi:MAG: hypothetical protein QM790_19280 [Nibricoccus sp.]
MSVLADIRLSILIFGPDPKSPPGGFVGDLARKRVEIRDALVADGHTACFPEDLMTGSPDPDLNNAFLFEELLVRKYDMIVHLVASYGSVSELSLFMRDGNRIASKVALYFNKDHETGIAYHQAAVVKKLGASLHSYVYPVDITACNLMTNVREKVEIVRLAKFYS